MTTVPPIPKIKIDQINQVCIVTRDVRAAMRQYWEIAGIGPWKLYDVGGEGFAEFTYRGQPGKSSLLLALADVGNLQIELIQPVEGENVYQDFLDRHGEGVHHLATMVDDIDQTTAQAEASGLEVIQAGRRVGAAKRGFVYLDTEGSLHTTLEFLQKSSGGPPREPLEVYP